MAVKKTYLLRFQLQDVGLDDRAGLLQQGRAHRPLQRRPNCPGARSASGPLRSDQLTSGDAVHFAVAVADAVVVQLPHQPRAESGLLELVGLEASVSDFSTE